MGPNIQSPSQQYLELGKKKLDEQFDEIEKSLAGVQDSSAAVAKSVEDQTESLESMTGVLECTKTNDDKREQELLDPQGTRYSHRSNIRSLKSLLLNRRGPVLPLQRKLPLGAHLLPSSTTFQQPRHLNRTMPL